MEKFYINEFDKERNIYYKSIKGLFSHLVVGTLYYLYAVKSIAEMGYPNEQERNLNNHIRVFSNSFYTGLHSFCTEYTPKKVRHHKL